ncbi:MAG: twin-arginine translocase TatA/TatE family subunit [Euzebyales bacterium]|nr:twin-arginine translocase TatA/TatE family subunit [Euzebyales bacterium]
MPNLGGPELIIVLAIFVLLFGAKKLPELGSSVGRSIKNFKAGVTDGKNADGEADATPEPRAETSVPPRTETSVPPSTQISRDA